MTRPQRWKLSTTSHTWTIVLRFPIAARICGCIGRPISPPLRTIIVAPLLCVLLLGHAERLCKLVGQRRLGAPCKCRRPAMSVALATRMPATTASGAPAWPMPSHVD